MPSITNISINRQTIAPSEAFNLTFTLDNTTGSSVYGSITGCEIEIYATVNSVNYLMYNGTIAFIGVNEITRGNARATTVAIETSGSEDIFAYLVSNSTRALPLYFKFRIVTKSSQISPTIINAIEGNTIYALNARMTPNIDEIAFKRCDSSGVVDEQGTELLLTLKTSFANSSYYDCFHVLFEQYDGLNRSFIANKMFDPSVSSDLQTLSDFVTGVVDSDVLIGELDSFNYSSSYYLRVTLGDNYESSKLTVSIPSSFVNVHLSAASTGGVALGRFSGSTDNNPMFESNYPAHLYGGLSVYNDTNIYGDLEVRDTSLLTGDVTCKGDLSVSDGTITGETITGTQISAGTNGLSSSGGLSITGDSNFYGNLEIAVGNKLSVRGNNNILLLEASGMAVKVNGSLSVGGSACLTYSNFRASVTSAVTVAQNSIYTGTVTFSSPYASGEIPIVVIGFYSDSDNSYFGNCSCSVVSVSNTGFTYKIFNRSDGQKSPQISWIAYH